jgi:hypothetical protein
LRIDLKNTQNNAQIHLYIIWAIYYISIIHSEKINVNINRISEEGGKENGDETVFEEMMAKNLNT